ncbi:MAG: GNAT family N-acetyltransferase [Actinomycetes bacterium]
MTPSSTGRGYALRTASAADWDAMYRADARAFGFPYREEDRDAQLPLTEFDRMLLAEDGAEIVGMAGAYSLEMAVPGGMQPMAGVTWVSVSPTHRRQGILTSLMRTQLTEQHEQEREPVAALWASEAAIYGRFGYGLASTSLALRIPRDGTATLAGPGEDDLAVWFADVTGTRGEIAAVHEAQVAERPGQFRYDSRWWDALLADPEHRRGGATELRCLLAHDGRRTRGYALFATAGGWHDGLPTGELRVRQLTALDPGAYAALWRTLLGTDLVSAVVTHNRPVDDPLLHLLLDIRRAAPRVSDNLWVRVVDVDRGLGARTYASPVDIVLDVEDALCPWNAGRWRLSGDEKGATCERTTDSPDLTVTARDLGAAYLGGTNLTALGGAGRVREHRTGALTAASRAFLNDLAPWCPTIF